MASGVCDARRGRASLHALEDESVDGGRRTEGDELLVGACSKKGEGHERRGRQTATARDRRRVQIDARTLTSDGVCVSTAAGRSLTQTSGRTVSSARRTSNDSQASVSDEPKNTRPAATIGVRWQKAAHPIGARIQVGWTVLNRLCGQCLRECPGATARSIPNPRREFSRPQWLVQQWRQVGSISQANSTTAAADIQRSICSARNRVE